MVKSLISKLFRRNRRCIFSWKFEEIFSNSFSAENFFTELLWPVAFAAPFFFWYNIYMKYAFNKLCVQHDCIEQYYQTDNLVASHSLFLKALFARISKKELIRWEQCCSYPIILFWMLQLIRMVYIYIYLLAILNHTITVVTNIAVNLSDICHWQMTNATDIVLVSSFLILNSFHTLFFSCVSVANFEPLVPCKGGWYHKQKASQKNLFFHFAITETCVAMCLAEDRTRMGGI